jgi:hypothetical protein
MIGVHWSDCWVEWLRHIVPELDGVPLYLRSAREIPEGHIDRGALAWTGRDQDLILRPTLEASGYWRGRGAAIVVSEDWFELTRNQQHGVLIHEAAHIFQSDRAWLKDPSTFTFMEELLLKPGGIEFVTNAWRNHAGVALIDPESLRREQHNAVFVRCGLHIQRRACGMVGIDDCQLFCSWYSSKDPDGCLKALSGELCKGGDLWSILKTDPPKEFAALFPE